MSGFLGALLNVGARAAGDYAQGEARSADADHAAILQRAQLARQQQQDAIQQAIAERQAASAAIQDHLHQLQGQKLADEIAHPTLDPNSPEVFARKAALERQKIIDEARLGYHPAPEPHVQALQSQDAQGNPVYTVFDKDRQTFHTTDVRGRPVGHGGGGAAQGAQVPVADMEQRYQEIAGAANDLAAGKWNITRGMQSREGLDYGVAREAAKGTPSLAHMGASALLRGANVGGGDYGKYQALMNSTRALGDDVAKVFKGRQNEESVLREVALSELTPDDYNNPQVVDQKLSRLRHVIHLARINNPAQVTGAEAPSPVSPVRSLSAEDQAHAQRDPGFAAWLRGQGYHL